MQLFCACHIAVPRASCFYLKLAVEYFIYSVSEGTVSVFRNFIQGCYCVFYKCYAVINMKLLSNLNSEGLLFKFSWEEASQTPKINL